MMDRANLGYLGESFQYRLAHAFMDDRAFFEDLSCIVDQNMFTDPYLKVFVGVMKNYFEVRGCVPSYDAMQIELRALCHTKRKLKCTMRYLTRFSTHIATEVTASRN